MRRLLIISGSAAALVGAGLLSYVTPTPLAALVSAPPEGYDPAQDPLLAHESGAGCFPQEYAREVALIDDTIAKFGHEIALGWAERERLSSGWNAAAGEAGQRVLEHKRAAIGVASLFGAERRARIGEWSAMKRYLRASASQKPAVADASAAAVARQDAFGATLKDAQCPVAHARVMDRVRHQQTVAVVGRVEEGLRAFRADMDRYPSDKEGLAALLSGEAILGSDAARWKQPYAKAEDLVDAWENPFVYSALYGGSMYTLRSLGAEGKNGGTYDHEDIVAVGSARAQLSDR